MRIFKNIKNYIAVFAILAITVTAIPVTNNVNAAMAAMSISPLSMTEVQEGGNVIFTLKYTNDIQKIKLNSGYLNLDGFTANINVVDSGNSRVVTLSNIKNKSGSDENGKKRVYISEGSAVSSDSKLANGGQTQSFTIKSKAPADTTAPKANISGPNPAEVYAGGTVSYKITYTDNVGIRKISLIAEDIRLDGFTANKNVSINGNVATITLSNIQGAVGGNKKIFVSGGTAIDEAFNLCNSVTGSAFSIKEKTTVVDPGNNGNNGNNVDNNGNDNKDDNNGKSSDRVANPNTGK